MALADFWKLRWLGISYRPQPQATPFMQRMATQSDDELEVNVSVLDHQESKGYFGVPLARRGIQPVYLKISNHGQRPFRLRLASLDPNYYPPLEAAFICHFRIVKRLMGYGLLAWFFFPLLLLLPFKIIGARLANARMDAFFRSQGFGWGILKPGSEHSGFVFTSLDEGVKQLTIRLQGEAGAKDFHFSIPVPGLRVDHGGNLYENEPITGETIDCDARQLRERLETLPATTTNKSGHRTGDPLNLVAIGEFATILNGFGARWDETEIINLRSCWRMAKAFLLGSPYRYSPVSPLYVSGRCQDFALQKARQTIDQRLHLRLWLTPYRFEGKPVWIGQISRDIGVRFTWRTWNLTTHKIDPDVDDARDCMLDDLMEANRVSHVGYVLGVQAAPQYTPRHNLTGDPYFTNGQRAVAIFSETRESAVFLDWA